MRCHPKRSWTRASARLCRRICGCSQIAEIESRADRKSKVAIRRTQQALSRVIRIFLVATLTIASLVGLSAPPAFAAHHQDLVGKPAPDFVRTGFNGQSVNLAHFHGKVVLLNFWATWCAPCLVEMPTFAAWQWQYGPQGLQVIGISMDDSATSAHRLADRLKLDYPVAMGDPRLAERYGGVLGLPLTFLIDREGIIRARFQGETAPKTIEREVKSLLASAH